MNTESWSSIRPVAASLTTALVGQAALVLSGVIVARGLGPTDRGHFALIGLLPLIFAQLGAWGLPQALPYFVIERGLRWDVLYRRLYSVVLVQLVACSAADLVAVWALFAQADDRVRTAALLSVPVVPALLAQQYGLAVFQSQRRFGYLNVLRLLPGLSYVAAMVFLWTTGEVHIVSVTLGWTGANVLLSLVIATAAIRSARRSDRRAEADRHRDVTPSEDAPATKTIVRFGLRGLVGAISPTETFRADQALVGLLVAPRALGFYVAALSFTNLARLLGQSIGLVAYPQVAATEPRDRSRVTVRFLAFACVLIGAVSVAIELAAPHLVRLLFGSAFSPAVPLVRILTLASCLVAVRRVLAECYRGAGDPTRGSLAEAASWLFVGLTLVPLTSLYGAYGATIALLAAAAASLAVIVLPPTAPLRLVSPSSGAVVLTSVGAGFVVASLPRISIATLGRIAPVLLLCAIVAYGIGRIARRRADILEPIFPALVLAGLTFGVRPLTHADTDAYYFGFPIAQTLPHVTILGLLGTVSLLLGYEIARSKRGGASTDRCFDPEALRLGVLGLLTAGSTLYFAYLASSGSVLEGLRLLARGRSVEVKTVFGPSSEYLSSAPILIACAAVVLVVTRRQTIGWLDRRWIGGLSIVPALLFFLQGQRRFILPCLLVPLLARYLVTGSRPRLRSVLIVGALGFLVLATIPYQRSVGGRKQSGGLVAAFSGAVTHPGKTWQRFITGSDTEVLPAFAAELRYYGDRNEPYTYGAASLGDLLLAPIPSAVFPAKPPTARDELLTNMFGGPCISSLCPDFTAFGKFYQDGGPFGIVLGSLGVGHLAGAVWRRHQRHRTAISSVLAAVTTIFLAIGLRADFTLGLIWALLFVVPITLTLTFASGAASKKRASYRPNTVDDYARI